MNTDENGDSIKRHPLVVQSCLTIIEQLKKDYSEYKKWEASKEEYGPLNISLAARWVPREKSSFGWVNAIIAELMFSELFYVNMPKHIFENALLKAKIRLKKIFTPKNPVETYLASSESLVDLEYRMKELRRKGIWV